MQAVGVHCGSTLARRALQSNSRPLLRRDFLYSSSAERTNLSTQTRPTWLQASSVKNEAVVEMVDDDTALPEDETMAEIRRVAAIQNGARSYGRAALKCHSHITPYGHTQGGCIVDHPHDTLPKPCVRSPISDGPGATVTSRLLPLPPF